MFVQQQIEEKIRAAFAPAFIELLNESFKHSVPKNSETHFKLTLVSEAFTGISKIQRHQKVYAVLADDMNNPIHALSLNLFAPDEWQAKKSIPETPPCLGGSKLEGKFQ